jgi:hypothetical protein
MSSLIWQAFDASPRRLTKCGALHTLELTEVPAIGIDGKEARRRTMVNFGFTRESGQHTRETEDGRF